MLSDDNWETFNAAIYPVDKDKGQYLMDPAGNDAPDANFTVVYADDKMIANWFSICPPDDQTHHYRFLAIGYHDIDKMKESEAQLQAVLKHLKEEGASVELVPVPNEELCEYPDAPRGLVKWMKKNKKLLEKQ